MSESTHPYTNSASPYPGLLSTRGLDFNHLEPIHTQVQAWQTEHGTQVRLVQTRELPMVDLVLQFNAGSSLDNDIHGVAALTLHMLDKGTQTRPASAFAEQFEGLGAKLGKYIGLEQTVVSLRSLSATALLDPAIELFTDMLARPVFDELELTKVKARLQGHSAAQASSAASRGRGEAFAHLYAGHPYGTPFGTTPEGIAAATPEHLRAFHQRGYSANNLALTLVGDVSREAAEGIVEQICQALPQGWAAAQLPSPPKVPARIIHVQHAGASNAMLLAAPLNALRTQPDYPALVLASDVFATGVESRLMVELRQRRGLTYHAGGRLLPHKAGGVYTLEWDIDAAYVAASQERVEALLRQYLEQGPTEDELQRARQQLAGQLIRTVSSNQALAELLADAAQQGLPANIASTYLGQLAAVTPASAREALQQAIDLPRRVLVSVGPIAEQLPLPEPPDQ